jgi:hypothetical protein
MSDQPIRVLDHTTWTQLAPLVLDVDLRLAECPPVHHVHMHPEDYLATIGQVPAPGGNPIHDQLRVELAARQLVVNLQPMATLERIRQDQASLDWHDRWAAERQQQLGDCCLCCVAAVERGDDIGHTPGPGACPHPPCDWHQGGGYA